jgi:hypothetical protein
MGIIQILFFAFERLHALIQTTHFAIFFITYTSPYLRLLDVPAW